MKKTPRRKKFKKRMYMNVAYWEGTPWMVSGIYYNKGLAMHHRNRGFKTIRVMVEEC